MKRLILSILLVCVTAVSFIAVTPGFTAEANAEHGINVNTYFYDRIPARAQYFYNYFKDYFDNYSGGIGTRKINITDIAKDMLPESPSFDDYQSLNNDVLAGESALYADEPMYRTKGRVAGIGYNDPGDKVFYQLEMEHTDLHMNGDLHLQVDAKIRQIIQSVNSGDRYTRLRKMSHYILTNFFYDPYLDAINDKGSINLETRGQTFDVSVFGVVDGIFICEGFSQLVKVLCDELDIPCVIMGNHMHAWNIVQMDDGNWYRLDMTNQSRLGWDADLPHTLEDYFDSIFLNNNTIAIDDFYVDPYMINIGGNRYVTEFPEYYDGRYEYNGSTTDFSYQVAPCEYVPGQPRFDYKVNEDYSTCTIINYIGEESGDLIIPSEINGYTVTAIAPYAFYYCSGFTGRLVIPDTVETIGNAAFAGCYGITEVELPDSLGSIGAGAFAGCKAVSQLQFPVLLTDIAEFAFFDCDGLNNVYFNEHIRSLGNRAFGYIEDTIKFYAPQGSVAQQYANSNGLEFAVHGELCNFDDADGKYEFDDHQHYYTCQHGATFGYGEHTIDKEFFECTDACTVCNAEYCHVNGFAEKTAIYVNSSVAYQGDIECICGNSVGMGEIYCESTGVHAPYTEDLIVDDTHHFYVYICGEKIDPQKHTGGKLSFTERPVCDLCGFEYGYPLFPSFPIEEDFISALAHYPIFWAGPLAIIAIIGAVIAVIVASKKKRAKLK